jgi:hypothetical protein
MIGTTRTRRWGAPAWVALVVVASHWVGCNLVPQTLPPGPGGEDSLGSGNGGAASPSSSGSTTATASDASAFSVGTGSSDGGGGATYQESADAGRANVDAGPSEGPPGSDAGPAASPDANSAGHDASADAAVGDGSDEAGGCEARPCLDAGEANDGGDVPD